GVYKLSDLDFELAAEGKAVPGGKQKVEVTGHGVYNLGAGTLEVNDLEIDAAGLAMSGQLAGTGLNDAPAFTGSLAIAEFNPHDVMANLDMALPELQGDNALTSASLDAQFNATTNSAAIEQLNITLDDTAFTGTARVTNF